MVPNVFCSMTTSPNMQTHKEQEEQGVLQQMVLISTSWSQSGFNMKTLKQLRRQKKKKKKKKSCGDLSKEGGTTTAIIEINNVKQN